MTNGIEKCIILFTRVSNRLRRRLSQGTSEQRVGMQCLCLDIDGLA